MGHHHDGSVSPRTTTTRPTPKNVSFELLFPDDPLTKARIPLRVQIYPHDTTDSIVTTVKNFYGLYSGPSTSKGVSFEDVRGNTLIARYENFGDNMVVYVRVIEEPALSPGNLPANTYQPNVFSGNGYPSQAPQAFGDHILRPISRTSRRRSPSPSNPDRRSGSTGKGRSQLSEGARGSGSQNGHDGPDAMSGYTSGDGAPGSSSGKNKDHLGNTEISLENIVEGGRRKRAKFESSVRSVSCMRPFLQRDINLSILCDRSFRYSRLPRCQVRSQTPPYLLCDVPRTTVSLCRISRMASTLSRTRDLCNLRKTITMVSDMPASMRPLHQSSGVATALAILLPLPLARASCLPPTLP